MWDCVSQGVCLCPLIWIILLLLHHYLKFTSLGESKLTKVFKSVKVLPISINTKPIQLYAVLCIQEILFCPVDAPIMTFMCFLDTTVVLLK